jgi:hypothetical protein
VQSRWFVASTIIAATTLEQQLNIFQKLKLHPFMGGVFRILNSEFSRTVYLFYICFASDRPTRQTNSGKNTPNRCIAAILIN